MDFGGWVSGFVEESGSELFGEGDPGECAMRTVRALLRKGNYMSRMGSQARELVLKLGTYELRKVSLPSSNLVQPIYCVEKG